MIVCRCAALLLAGSMVVAALTGGTGIALASPDPAQQPGIDTIDDWNSSFRPS